MMLLEASRDKNPLFTATDPRALDALFPNSLDYPELLVDRMIRAVRMMPLGGATDGLENKISEALDNKAMLKIFKHLILESRDTQVLKIASEAYKTDSGTGYDIFAERSQTNPVESTLSLIKRVDEKGGFDVHVDLKTIYASKETLAEARADLLCALGEFPACAHDCEKGSANPDCPACKHCERCASCKSKNKAKLGARDASKAGIKSEKKKLWLEYLDAALQQAVGEITVGKKRNRDLTLGSRTPSSILYGESSGIAHNGL